jgi:hypothetical protein
MLSGPSETGKTYAALYRLDSEARKYTNSNWVLLRKVRKSMDSTVLKTWHRVIALRGGVETYGGSHPGFYTYGNGAKVWILGMDTPDKILSGEFDGIYVNQAEELDEADWETLTTRATGRGAVTDTPMVFGDCNPGPADHWIVRRAQSGALLKLDTTHQDNPTLYDERGGITPQGERSMDTLDRLTGIRRLRLRDGLWVGAEGQYFEQWDEALHTCAPFPIPADWPIWAAFDYGFSHNTAFGLYTKHDGTIYKIGEHVQQKWLPSQHATAMDSLCERLDIAKARITKVVAGLDVFQSKGDANGQTIAKQYEALGWRFVAASVDRITGAQELLTRLGNADANLPPTLKIVDTCVRTIATIANMVHDPNRSEDVLKVDADSNGRGGDDCYDETRYALMSERVLIIPATQANPIYANQSDPVYVPGKGFIS